MMHVHYQKFIWLRRHGVFHDPSLCRDGYFWDQVAKRFRQFSALKLEEPLDQSSCRWLLCVIALIIAHIIFIHAVLACVAAARTIVILITLWKNVSCAVINHSSIPTTI